MRSAAAVCLAACSLAAGCGGSSSAQEEPDAPTLAELWRAPGEDVAIVPGSADFGPGRVRLTFLVVDGEGRLVTRPTAKVWLARELEAVPFVETTARSEKIGVDAVEPGEAGEIFVTELQLDDPGTYWVLAEPVGGTKRIQAVGNVVVQEETQAPDVGAAAPASETPTLANAALEQLTTATEPDPELYRASVAQALAAEEPFVVAFATPRYCTSRTCGPVVDVVSAVREQHPGLRFIHVEIYQDNDPTKGENRWVREWALPSEPWIFVVGADGTIRSRFEGTVSVRELEEAVSSLPS
ncbi:MAG TPA: hypothetical protein VM184_02085 [Gaiellaceae bacterium]|nr:hypothetical protein [Gaiellaceae bacterium]